MTNEGVLDIVRKCNLKQGVEVIPKQAYLFNQKFKVNLCTKNGIKKIFQQVEIIVIVKNNIKVGGIYRMGATDLHWVIFPKYRGQHILSNILKQGVIQKLWHENKRPSISDNDDEKLAYLVSLWR